MLDPTQLPLLLSILDFLFDEGHKILQERREKRQSERQKTGLPTPDVQPRENAPGAEIQPVAAKNLIVKADLLKLPVADGAWIQYEQELAHTLHLMEIYARNYRLAQTQVAKWGEALVPPIVLNNLNEAENGLAMTQRRAQEILTKLYERPVDIGADDSAGLTAQ